MKNNSISRATRFSRPFGFYFAAVILGTTIFTLSASKSLAQTTDSSVDYLIASYNLTNQWKSPADYSAIVTTMRESTAQILADPNIQAPEFSLYTGYDRMLGYMQSDLIANVPVEGIAEKNFNRVVTESHTDPLLINMHAEEFSVLYNVLIQKLRQ